MLTQSEQYFLELTNLIRLDPRAAAADMLAGGDLNAGVAAYNQAHGTTLDFSDVAPMQALAPNATLTGAARLHSVWMMDENVFSHAGDPAFRGHEDYPHTPSYPANSNAGERMAAAGYTFTGGWGWAENLASWGSSAPITAGEPIETHVTGLFESVGHRANTLHTAMRETGIGQHVGLFTDDGADWHTSLLTQKFAVSGNTAFVTGVIYDDADSNARYGMGEGVGAAQVTVGGTQTTTWAAGGYVAAAGPSATVEVTFNPAGGPITVSTVMAGENVKLDLVDGQIVHASGDLTLLAGATDARILGAVGATLTGNAADNQLQGGAGDDVIDALGGTDTIVFRGARAEYDITEDGDTVTVTHLTGGVTGDGTDTITGAEALAFADQTITLDAGEQPDPGGVHSLTGHVRLPDGTPLAGVALQMAVAADPLRHATTGADGSFVLQHDGGEGILGVAHGRSDDGGGVTVTDALNVLRMAIGLEPLGSPADAFDFIAADVTLDGRVQVTDALQVLRHAVGLDGGAAGDYLLIDGTPPAQSIGAVTVDSAVETTLAPDMDMSLTAIRLGDLGIYDMPV